MLEEVLPVPIFARDRAHSPGSRARDHANTRAYGSGTASPGFTIRQVHFGDLCDSDCDTDCDTDNHKSSTAELAANAPRVSDHPSSYWKP
jgi:hypothetical protein